MLHIAVCGQIDFAGESVADGEAGFRTLIEECAREVGFSTARISEFESPLTLIQAMGDSRQDSAIDLIVCGTDMPGMSAIELVRELRAEGFTHRIAVAIDELADAAEALANRVDIVMVSPVDMTVFAEKLTKLFRTVKEERSDSVEIRAREGLRRVPVSQLLYAETVDHDQVIHLTDDSQLSIRMSSQALFELLERYGCFFKAGSSYIVNVRLVKKVDPRASTATMFGGVVIPIPGRVRTSLEDAILA